MGTEAHAGSEAELLVRGFYDKAPSVLLASNERIFVFFILLQAATITFINKLYHVCQIILLKLFLIIL